MSWQVAHFQIGCSSAGDGAGPLHVISDADEAIPGAIGMRRHCWSCPADLLCTEVLHELSGRVCGTGLLPAVERTCSCRADLQL